MQRRGLVANQSIASKIERIATTAIRSIEAVSNHCKEDDVTDAAGLDDTLRRQEGVLPRRATLLGPESEGRYKKGIPIHDASGKFRRSDAKG